MQAVKPRDERAAVIDWRFKSLLEAAPQGVNGLELLDLAQIIAADLSIDLHRAVGMLSAGASLDQVANVLL